MSNHRPVLGGLSRWWTSLATSPSLPGRSQAHTAKHVW